jgi:hypothetical protein
MNPGEGTTKDYVAAAVEQRRPTWEGIARALNVHGFATGEYAGVPMPLPGLRLRLAEKHPMKAALEAFYLERGDEREFVCTTSDANETVHRRNRWFSERLQRWIELYDVDGKVVMFGEPHEWARKLTMDIETLGATIAWDVAAEFRAMVKLEQLVGAHKARLYAFTGGFIETSSRSGVTYYFRRLRPTLALRPGANGEGMRVLAALCLHPIGYYDTTRAGVMVPTDDVLAHLLLMRGDEHRFWRQANHHAPWEAEAGL